MDFMSGNKLRFLKRDLDGPHLDVQNKHFSKDFKIEIIFQKLRKPRSRHAKLDDLLASEAYTGALTDFLTNNGGIEQLELVTDTREYEKIPEKSKTVLRQRSNAIYGKHKDNMSKETQLVIAAAMNDPTPRLFSKAKMEAMQEVERKSLPRFLISQTYNDVEEPLRT
jgi:hypothetical protein